MNAKSILPGQKLNKSLNTHWKNNMQKEHAPRAFKIYNIYFVLWKLSHIYPHTVDTGYFSWNKLFSSYWNSKESQEITMGFKGREGHWWQRQNKVHAENLTFEDWSPHTSLTKKILIFKSIHHQHTISQLKTNLFYLLMPWTFH